jgi:hypothetical protein
MAHPSRLGPVLITKMQIALRKHHAVSSTVNEVFQGHNSNINLKERTIGIVSPEIRMAGG